jgi:hypothetical protein
MLDSFYRIVLWMKAGFFLITCTFVIFVADYVIETTCEVDACRRLIAFGGGIALLLLFSALFREYFASHTNGGRGDGIGGGE